MPNVIKIYLAYIYNRICFQSDYKWKSECLQ